MSHFTADDIWSRDLGLKTCQTFFLNVLIIYFVYPRKCSVHFALLIKHLISFILNSLRNVSMDFVYHILWFNIVFCHIEHVEEVLSRRK